MVSDGVVDFEFNLLLSADSLKGIRFTLWVFTDATQKRIGSRLCTVSHSTSSSLIGVSAT